MSSSAAGASDRFISYPLDSVVRERLSRCGERPFRLQMPIFFDLFRTIMFMDSTFYAYCTRFDPTREDLFNIRAMSKYMDVVNVIKSSREPYHLPRADRRIQNAPYTVRKAWMRCCTDRRVKRKNVLRAYWDEKYVPGARKSSMRTRALAEASPWHDTHVAMVRIHGSLMCRSCSKSSGFTRMDSVGEIHPYLTSVSVVTNRTSAPASIHSRTTNNRAGASNGLMVVQSAPRADMSRASVPSTYIPFSASSLCIRLCALDTRMRSMPR